MALAPSSPRLPSPPPPAEIQIGPKSPSCGTASPEPTLLEQTALDAHSRRRIHPGTKAADMAAGPPLVPLNELESAFQLQEHLAALHYHHAASGTQSITRSAALQLSQPPPGIDRTLWLYELCRFLISQCNSLIVGFLFDTPPCSASTCPEMRASEWQFLCAVHEQPKSCCAIDYCCHTLDWAANVVSDQKIFPSRFAVLSDVHSRNIGVKNLVNVFRRLHRIFAHAWFQHRSVFWAVEGQMGLYVFFKTVCDLYDLLPAENYKLPPEAEGLETPSPEPQVERPPPSILRPPSQQQRSGGGADADDDDDDGLHPTSRTNTRRHIRSSPSTGSAVTTVIEADEEDADTVAGRMRDMHISAPEAGAAEETDEVDVPVMVEQSAMTAAPPQETIVQETMAQQEASSSLTSDAAPAVDETVMEVEPEQDARGEPDETVEPVVPPDEPTLVEPPLSGASEGPREGEGAPVSAESERQEAGDGPSEPTPSGGTKLDGDGQPEAAMVPAGPEKSDETQ